MQSKIIVRLRVGRNRWSVAVARAQRDRLDYGFAVCEAGVGIGMKNTARPP